MLAIISKLKSFDFFFEQPHLIIRREIKWTFLYLNIDTGMKTVHDIQPDPSCEYKFRSVKIEGVPEETPSNGIIIFLV